MISTILSRLVAQIFSAYGMELRTPDASCDPAMCRTTDGRGGFDCWADGVGEKFECADGYEVVKTGETFSGDFEITCCPPSEDAVFERVCRHM